MSDSGLDKIEAIKQISEFFGDATLIAHNAQFDIGFIQKAYLDNHLGVLKQNKKQKNSMRL